MLIVQTSDFTNFQGISLQPKTISVLQAYIDRYEKRYINMLLSCDVSAGNLAQLFIADLLNGAPQTQRFKDIFNPFDVQYANTVHHSDGIKDLLVSCIFYHYVLDNESQHSQQGVTASQVETANKSSAGRFAAHRWNNMLESWNNIKWYMQSSDYASNYPEYTDTDVPSASLSGIF